jgi:AhpD family alkylhydroperoxidase
MSENNQAEASGSNNGSASVVTPKGVAAEGGNNDPVEEIESVRTDGLIPVAASEPTNSYSMLEPRMKKVYGAYYKELYYTPERRVLDAKVQELISIAASLVAKCDGCLDGHMKKALDLGATKEEISETICIAAAINAAAMIDLSDRSAARLGLNHFPSKPPEKV